MFNGYKTYIVAVGFVVTGLEMYFVEGTALSSALLYVLNGLGIGAIRHGIKTS